MIEHLTPHQTAERMASVDPPLVVDVREGWERDLASIPGSVHVPMGEVPARLDELPRDRAIVLQCHFGGRSMQVAEWLDAQGYDRLANLDGGIDEWSATQDPETPRYS